LLARKKVAKILLINLLINKLLKLYDVLLNLIKASKNKIKHTGGPISPAGPSAPGSPLRK